jgi:hypothetical protein
MAKFTVSRWITDEVMNCTIQIESAGKPDARASTSSAAGLGQFIKDTWIDTVKKHRPDLYEKYSRDQLLAMRVGTATASLQVEMLARFTEDNAKILGPSCTPGDLYLAHFLGVGAAKKFLNANPNTSSRALAGDKAADANASIFAKNPTAGALRAWADTSMATRWAKAGKPDWVAKWYTGKAVAPDRPDPVKPPAPVPTPPKPVPPTPAPQPATKRGAIGAAIVAFFAAIAAAIETFGTFLADNWGWVVGVPLGIAVVIGGLYGFRKWRNRNTPNV